ncbi:M23 family metallopeptidase [Candidatus Gracilibacteria bacterium]|nr:M23 family metallopeptidase [Candidatus Gracilibacteria bacterium]
MLAILGTAWLVVQLFARPDAQQLSGWRGPGNSSASIAAAAEGTLSGRAEDQRGRGLSSALKPHGNPLNDGRTVMTQGYGVGTHAPAEVWGAIDLAIDGNDDGAADPQGSYDAPIYATHSGVVKVTPNSHPAGNHIWVSNEQFKTGYAHLAGFVVESGAHVERGQLIGYVGSTGMSSGPHLDYQIWEMQGGTWVNRNPLDFEPLAGL